MSTNSNAATINAMVEQSATGALAAQGIEVSQNRGGMSVNTESGAITIHGNPAQAGRIHDPGIDIGSTVQGIEARLHGLSEQLRAQTFDPNTGKGTFTLPEGSRERALVQQQLDTANRSAMHDIDRLMALKAQRAADDASARTSPINQQREAARMAFIGMGEDRQARAALWDAEAERQSAAAAVSAALKR